MRSIDIIVDRAGFYETWGCIVWVPAVYTLHTRTAVLLPSGASTPSNPTLALPLTTDPSPSPSPSPSPGH